MSGIKHTRSFVQLSSFELETVENQNAHNVNDFVGYKQLENLENRKRKIRWEGETSLVYGVIRHWSFYSVYNVTADSIL